MLVILQDRDVSIIVVSKKKKKKNGDRFRSFLVFFLLLIFPVILFYLCIKVGTLAWAQQGAAKWCLDRIRIRNAQHPNNNTSSALLAALDLKFAALEWELMIWKKIRSFQLICGSERAGAGEPRKLTRSALFLCSISGNTCSVSLFSGLRLFSQPYINMLCLRECACISQYMATPHSSISLNEKLYSTLYIQHRTRIELTFLSWLLYTKLMDMSRV